MKMIKGELLLANAFINKHLDRIIDWSIGDIRRCCNMNNDGVCDDNGALVGAFILWCCAIDYWGGLFTGNSSENGTKTRIREFINKYLPKYDWEKIYDLRWSLLHFYSPHNFILYHQNNIKDNINKHLEKSDKGILLHLGCSIVDLENAISAFRKEVYESNEMKIKIWRYYKAQPPIMPINFEFIQSNLSVSSMLSKNINITASGTASRET